MCLHYRRDIRPGNGGGELSAPLVAEGARIAQVDNPDGAFAADGGSHRERKCGGTRGVRLQRREAPGVLKASRLRGWKMPQASSLSARRLPRRHIFQQSSA